MLHRTHEAVLEDSLISKPATGHRFLGKFSAGPSNAPARRSSSLAIASACNLRGVAFLHQQPARWLAVQLSIATTNLIRATTLPGQALQPSHANFKVRKRAGAPSPPPSLSPHSFTLQLRFFLTAVQAVEEKEPRCLTYRSCLLAFRAVKTRVRARPLAIKLPATASPQSHPQSIPHRLMARSRITLPR